MDLMRMLPPIGGIVYLMTFGVITTAQYSSTRPGQSIPELSWSPLSKAALHHMPIQSQLPTRQQRRLSIHVLFADHCSKKWYQPPKSRYRLLRTRQHAMGQVAREERLSGPQNHKSK